MSEHGGKKNTGLCPRQHRRIAQVVDGIVTIKPHERRWRECTIEQFHLTQRYGGYE